MSDSFTLGGGPYHFFVRSSFSAAWSSIDSANSFFSLRFSSSSDRRRLASDTSMPPYLAFQLYRVASETPCLRAKSAVVYGVLSLRHLRLARWCSLSLGGWWPRIRRGASRPARAAWSVQRLEAARW